MSLEILASPRFLSAYLSAMPGLQGLTEGVVHDFVRRFHSDPRTVTHKYDRLVNFRPPVLEMEISGAHRLLARYSENKLILLDMGGHEVAGRYSRPKYEQDMAKPIQAPGTFWPEGRSKLFLSLPDRTLDVHYPEEMAPEWLFFLEEEQSEIADSILGRILDEESAVRFIVGGPGTGKTCILLNILKFLVDCDFDIGLVISDELASYIEASSGLNVSQFRVDLHNLPELDVLLVDDLPDLETDLTEKASLGVVATFDPLQMSEAITDEAFSQAVKRPGCEYYALHGCYRQKENVGLATKRFADTIAASTPFLSEEKIQRFRTEHSSLTALANDLTFLNPHGYIQSYPDASPADVREEVKRLRKARSLFWSHWPSILIVRMGNELPDQIRAALSPILDKPYTQETWFLSGSDIKGLEYQHVLVFMEKTLFAQLEDGFKGSGQRVYRERRLLRIPFSRAKDSLVVFGLP